MKFLFVLLLPVIALAKPFVFEACNANESCFLITTPDAKSWEWKTDYTGGRFIRVYLQYGILDIPANNLSIKQKK